MHLALVALIVIFAIASPDFRTVENLLNILNQVAVVGIVSVGMTFVILTAGIDLSVGSLLALTSLSSGVFAATQTSTTGTVLLALAVPLIVGLVGGMINGAIVASRLATPLIVTLGTLTAFRGMAVQYRVNPIHNLQDWYREIGSGRTAGIPNGIYIFIAIILVASLVLNRTRFGREVYAVGGNEQASRAAGINVARVKFAVYAISGLCVAVAAIINTSRIGAAQAIAGQGLELQAIAAVVIGGASLFGGRGKISNTVIGTLILGVLFNGLVLLNVSSPIQNIIIGALVVAAVSLDGFFRRRSA
ncbi:ABC transporter permease [Planosporangium flavigriseum]|nr:ABC transporter permease [Planosporangium flavigriseum]